MKQKKQINIDVGKRIKISREKKKLTQEKLSEHLDVSVQYISDLERGVVGTSLTTLVKLCDILEVSSDYLLRGKSPEFFPEIAAKLETYTPEQVECFYRIMNEIDSFRNTDK